MSKSILRAFIAVLFLPLCTNLSAESAATAEPSAPKPPPNEGERGTIVYWQKELQGKNKRDVKSLLGTPQTIAEQGAIYNYPGEFFHPDLDQWRSLSIRFNADDLAESFTGEGSDTKTYKIEAPAWQQAADAAGVPAATPTPSPSPTPDLEAVKRDVEASVTTVEFTEPAPGFGDSGQGATGFLVEYNDKKYVVTNIHVLEGEASNEIQLGWHHGPRPGAVNSARLASQARVKSSFDAFQRAITQIPLPAIKSSSGISLSLSPTLLLSETRDIALIPLETDLKALRFSTKPPRRTQAVVILGNPAAGHTFAALEAEISQVGPDRFELDRVRGGELVGGMSGSPVVDAESGEVLGVFTYAVTHVKWIGDNVQSTIWGTEVIPMFKHEKRHFAYRTDNLSDLKPFTWAQFVNDLLIVNAIRQRTMNVFWASNAFDAGSGSAVIWELSPDFDNKVQLTYSSFVKDVARFVNSSDEDFRMRRWQEYQRRLETLLQTDLNNPQYRIVTPHARNIIDDVAAGERMKAANALRTAAGKLNVKSSN